MEPRRLLLVDDDADIRRIAQLSLQHVGGFEVVLAASGSEAVEMAQSSQPDAILLDVMMPGMDGLQTLAALRGLGPTADIPVVFLTAKVQPHEIDRYRALGAAGVICKPFDPLVMPQTLRGMLAG